MMLKGNLDSIKPSLLFSYIVGSPYSEGSVFPDYLGAGEMGFMFCD